MLKLTVIFAVIYIFLSVQHVQSGSLKNLKIQGILQSLQKQLLYEQLAEKKRQQFLGEALNEDYNDYTPIKQEHVASSLNKRKQRHQDHDQSDDGDDDLDDDRRDQHPQLLHQLERVYDKQSRDLQKLLNKQNSANSLSALLDNRSDGDRDDRNHKSRSVTKLASLHEKRQIENAFDRYQKSRPGSVLASILDDDMDDRLQDLSSYKSVYLVLDPEAIEKSHNKVKLGNLLSKFINAFRQSDQLDRREMRKERHYEGFAGRWNGRESKMSAQRNLPRIIRQLSDRQQEEPQYRI